MAKRKRVDGKGVKVAVLALVRGLAEEAVVAQLVQAGTPKDDAGLVVKEARNRIQLTADYNRDEELGKSIRRLERLIEANIDSEFASSKTIALQAQRELNKLLRLHEASAGATGEAEEGDGAGRADELSRTRAHLAGVLDAPDDYPLSELARMAAEKLRTADGGDDSTA